MSDSPNGTSPRELSDRSELIQEIAQFLADRLNFSTLLDGQAIEVVETKHYSHYAEIIFARKTVTAIACFFLFYGAFNTFESIVSDRWPMASLSCSILTILSGLSLIILLVIEVFQGAGEDIEILFKQGEYIFNDYQFVPSLNHLSFVLFLLVLGFLTIIFGFASLYTDLLRQNPSHFIGLQDGFLAVYFSIVTFSTVGYGDIHPDSIVARSAVICEIFMAMFFSLIVISTTLSWVIAHKRSQHEISIKKRIQARKKEVSEV